jgi:DNA (cytosine-5)-methyltransferase 1
MFRLVYEVKPRWVVAENVPGILSSDDGRFFGNILRDLASLRFAVEWGVLSAAGVGAPHLRRRVFVIAYPRLFGQEEHEIQTTRIKQLREVVANASIERGRGRTEPQSEGKKTPFGSKEMADTSKCEGNEHEVVKEYGRSSVEGIPGNGSCISRGREWWTVEPNVGRVADGVPSG